MALKDMPDTVKDALRNTQRRMLFLLNGHAVAKQGHEQQAGPVKHIYAGTANANKAAKARRRSKMARQSRRVNRGR
jgi:hypothetical protein